MKPQSNTAALTERAPIWTRIILRSGLATRCGLHAGDLAVLLCLADHANREGIAWPKQTTIMHETGLSKRGVRNASKRIVALGIVRRRKRFKIYEYMLPDAADIEDLIAPSTPAENAAEAQSAPDRGTECPRPEAQSAPDRGTECPRPEAQSAPQKVTTTRYKSEDDKSEAGTLSSMDQHRDLAEAQVLHSIETAADDRMRRILVGDVQQQNWRPAFKETVLALDPQRRLMAQRRAEAAVPSLPAASADPAVLAAV